MSLKRRIAVITLGALAGLTLCSAAQAQVRLVSAGFTLAGAPLTHAQAVEPGAPAPRSLAGWVELHAGMPIAERVPTIIISPISPISAAARPMAPTLAAFRTSLARDLRPAPLPAPMIEPMAALQGVRRLPLSLGTGNALDAFGDRRAMEHLLGARGQTRLYNIGVKLDL